MPTHFKRFVEDTEAPCALPTTFNNLHAELVFRVGSEVLDGEIQVGRVHHLLSTAGGTATGATTQLVSAWFREQSKPDIRGLFKTFQAPKLST